MWGSLIKKWLGGLGGSKEIPDTDISMGKTAWNKPTTVKDTPLMEWMKTKPWYQAYQGGSSLGRTLGLWK